MSFTITVSSAILSLTRVSCLRNVNKLSSSRLQKFHNCSKSFNFLYISWSLLGYSFELIIGKILCCIKGFFLEVLRSLIVCCFGFSFYLLVTDFGSTLFILKFVFFITSHGFLVWCTFCTIIISSFFACIGFFLFCFLCLCFCLGCVNNWSSIR